MSIPRRDAKQKPPAKAKAKAEKPPKADGVTKPKQSKSRNGCMTCKQKRLKCDETKPKCQQCHRRGVECGGYKKDFKWRHSEEGNFAPSKSARPPRSKRSSQDSKRVLPQQSPSPSEESGSTSSPMAGQGASNTSISPPLQSPPAKSRRRTSQPLRESHNLVHDPSSLPLEDGIHLVFAQPTDHSFPQSPHLKFEHQEPNNITREPSWSESVPEARAILSNPLLHQNRQTKLDCLLEGLPSNDEHAEGIQEDEIEEIIRDDLQSNNHLRERSSMFPASHLNYYPARSSRFAFSEPKLSPQSLEMLFLKFNKDTCGILSVKDGQNENPWRTIVWPMAVNSRALCHAIACMSAFHASKTDPRLNTWGIRYKLKSLGYLKEDIQSMTPDVALATSIALAFAESWDKKTESGSVHLTGGTALVNRALMTLKQNRFSSPEQTARIRFLCNTWLYLDVIARLTDQNLRDDTEIDMELWSQIDPFGPNDEIDPLMGCATTLFPIIQRVAKLVRNICERSDDSLPVIEQANELKEELEGWEPPSSPNRPEDPACEIQHSLRTAEAYRLATLLYLHQAVPRIPSRSSSHLARKVLDCLATVPITSRTVIVQIFPLLAAGCEVQNEEDRGWVRDRWVSMSRRMQIGNIDSCLDVVDEVWARRDRAEMIRQSSFKQMIPPWINPSFREPWSPVSADSFQICQGDMDMFRAASTAPEPIDISLMEPCHLSPDHHELWEASRISGKHWSPRGSMSGGRRRDSVETVEDMDFDFTVRGRLHWLGVMRDNGWEVLLG